MAPTESEEMAAKAAEWLRLSQQHVEKNEIKKTRKTATEAEKLFKSLGDELGMAEVHMVRALAEVKLEEPEEIRKNASKAADLFKKARRLDRQAAALDLIVESLTSTQEERPSAIADAIRLANRALMMHEETGNYTGQANAMEKIASLHFRAHELEQAEWAGKEAQSLWRRAGGHKEAIKMQFFLCEVYEGIMRAELEGHIASVKPSNPRCALQRVVALSNDAVYITKDMQGETSEGEALKATALYWRAQTRIWQGDASFVQDAMEMSDKALGLYQGIDDKRGQVSTMLLQASALSAARRWPAALSKADEALKLARGFELEDEVEKAHEAQEAIKAEQAQGARSGAPQQAGLDEEFVDSTDIATTETKVAKVDLDPDYLMSKLAEIVKEVAVADEDISQDEPLMDIGIDSLSSVTLVNAASQAFGVPLRPSVVFDYPTLRELVSHILEEA